METPGDMEFTQPSIQKGDSGSEEGMWRLFIVDTHPDFTTGSNLGQATVPFNHFWPVVSQHLSAL